MSLSLKLGLRSKIIALSSLLLLLPWFAYQFINEMESFLRLGQQQTLLGTTSAIAMSLHERPRLFNEHANSLPDIKKGRDLYVYDLTNDISIDGDLVRSVALRFGFQPMHDWSLSAYCALKRTSIYFIKEPLIMYRRHSNTFTGRKKTSFFRKLTFRTNLLRFLLNVLFK